MAIPDEIEDAVALLVAEEGPTRAERLLQERFRSTQGRERKRTLAALAALRRQHT